MKPVLHLSVFLSVFYGCTLNAYAADAGAYSSVPPRSMALSVANKWYRFDFPVLTAPLSGSVITDVSYEYALGQRDVGGRGTLQVSLCHGNEDDCVDISAAQSGFTRAFQGQNAAVPFILYYALISDTPVPPVSGSGSTRLMVNWERR